MKKLINSPETVVAEMCKGIEISNPEVEFLEKYKILKKREINQDKVTLISGGGSGHEPAHGGYVGTGMLDAAVCGDVFASPSQIQVYQGIKAAAGKKGTLLIIKNYSGDIMNFTNGAAMAVEEGFPVEYVKVEDDIAVTDSLYTVGRRGVAGTVFVHKIAGAAAQKGLELSEVKRLAQKAADSVRSIGAGYSSCTVPAAGTPTFSIEEDEMEYGVGIHGEPGRNREKAASAKALAQRMTQELLEDLKVEKEQEIAVLVNGFGATPLQELYIMAYQVFRELSQKGIKVYRTFTGNYMTSIDMQGCSVSFLRLDEELKEYLDLPAESPGFRVDGPVISPVYTPLKTEKAEENNGEFICANEWRQVKNDVLTLENIGAMVACMGNCILRNEVNFCKLDSHAGDGDFGSSIAKGFRKVQGEWTEILETEFSSVKEFLMACSMIIMEHCGGASGPVWGSAFRAAALQAGEKRELTLLEFAGIMQAAVEGIQRTGERSFGRGAVPGDKTLIDALVPCAEQLRKAAEENQKIKEALMQGAAAAVKGAEETKNLVARMGRAGTVGKRSLGYPDAGAYALGVIFTEISDFLLTDSKN
ncbi:MAG TPA: dihydroxyacetone kinase subunit DhaK [Candidatus Blautia avistercoris]|nr:dihydroxyacetone kinase subunit DhaK [Candidatus Blautia avistercoris]